MAYPNRFLGIASVNLYRPKRAVIQVTSADAH
jgi:hypothetical protein